MKATFVFENISFERGKEPYDILNLGTFRTKLKIAMGSLSKKWGGGDITTIEWDEHFIIFLKNIPGTEKEWKIEVFLDDSGEMDLLFPSRLDQNSGMVTTTIEDAIKKLNSNITRTFSSQKRSINKDF